MSHGSCGSFSLTASLIPGTEGALNRLRSTYLNCHTRAKSRKEKRNDSR